MNGRPFTPAEDAVILAKPQLGSHRLGKLLGRPYQSCRDRRERLIAGRPLHARDVERAA